MLRLAILMFCVFSITTGEFVVAGILPEVATDLEVTVGTAGLLVTTYAVGMIVGGPALTALTARIDRKRLMLALLAVAVAGNAVSALAPEFSLLLAARVATALVTSTFFAQAIVIAVQSAPPERAGTMVAPAGVRNEPGDDPRSAHRHPDRDPVGMARDVRRDCCRWRPIYLVAAGLTMCGLLMTVIATRALPGTHHEVAANDPARDD